MKIINEFKDFALKGNVVDMGVGIIIGGAFTQVINSFVKDVVMPPLGLLTGGIDFSDKAIVLKKATDTAEAITLNYGTFINVLVSFLIVSIVIFMVIKQMNRLREEILKKEEEEEEKPEEKKPDQVDLLSEIRDLIKNNKI
jgi:large conductance mechanosensitive channel